MKTKSPNIPTLASIPEARGIANLECRDLTQEEKESGFLGVIKGSIPFNADSQVMQSRGRDGKPIKFVERIDPLAFATSLSEDRDIVATAGHAEDPLSAFAIIGENLTITANERSMDWEAKIPDTNAGKDLMRLIDMKVIRGTSFEFITREGGEKWEARGGDMQVRTITDARLLEVNPVKWPAYIGTSLTVEMRGRYASENGIVDWYDPTITAPTKYAESLLYRLTEALNDTLAYLRAEPEGSLKVIADRQVSQCATDIAELASWLAENGADVNAQGVAALSMRSIEKFNAEKREAKESSKEESEESPEQENHSIAHRKRALKLIDKSSNQQKETV